MEYKQRDIILLPFPFTDNVAISKKRPGIIISNTTTKNTFIVAKITSTIKNGDYSFLLNNDDLDFVLNYKSEVRTDQIFTIHKTAIIKK